MASGRVGKLACRNIYPPSSIANYLRRNEQGEAEVWVNLEDVLTWLGELPAHSNVPAAGAVALEIRQMLIDQFSAAIDAYGDEQHGP